VVRQVVEGHDPTKSSGRQLGKKWRELFETKRAEFLASRPHRHHAQGDAAATT
jgi:hypothetical protein